METINILNLDGHQFTVETLEKLVLMLQQHRSVAVVNCAPETPSLLTLGATLSRWAENERTPSPYQVHSAMKHLKSGFCVCGDPKERMAAFCLDCYEKIPDDLKRKIGLVLKDKFVNNYLKAREMLRPQPEAKYDGEMMSGIAKTTNDVLANHNV